MPTEKDLHRVKGIQTRYFKSIGPLPQGRALGDLGGPDPSRPPAPLPGAQALPSTPGLTLPAHLSPHFSQPKGRLRLPDPHKMTTQKRTKKKRSRPNFFFFFFEHSPSKRPCCTEESAMGLRQEGKHTAPPLINL